MLSRSSILMPLCLAAACGQEESPRQVDVGAASGAPLATIGKNDTARVANQAERDILRKVAMYTEFERQAIEVRRGNVSNFGLTVIRCIEALADRILDERKSDLAELAAASATLNIETPDALDEDYKGYLGLIEKGDPFPTAFSAEQALIHIEMIGEVQGFVSSQPDSPIQPWAERVLGRLKDRMSEIDPDSCADRPH